MPDTLTGGRHGADDRRRSMTRARARRGLGVVLAAGGLLGGLLVLVAIVGRPPRTVGRTAT